MRRITLTVVTTLAILVLLFGYRTSRNQSVTPTTVAVGSAHVVVGGSASVVSSMAGPDATSGAAAPQITVPSTTSSTTAGTTATATSATKTGVAAKTTSTVSKGSTRSVAPSTSAPATSSSPATTKVDGSAVSTRYGDIQVEVSITNGRITDVQALEYPNQDPRDQQINDDALPQLQAQVLSAQSADISGVSGATFTTQGYVTSLQSALDAANFK